MNFRVLLISTVGAAVILGGFFIAFVWMAPSHMEGVQKTSGPEQPVKALPAEPKSLPSSPDTYNPGKDIQKPGVANEKH